MLAEKYYSMMTDRSKVDVLRKTGHYFSVPSGVSMWPMLKSGENTVDIVEPQAPLKRYDVVLYYRPSDDKCVLHRILKVKEKHFVIYGDNCHTTEIVPHDAVIGIAAQFYKNGKWISVNSRRYMLYVHLWCDFLPLRRAIIRVRNHIRGRRKKHD